MIVERDTPNQQANTSWVTPCRRGIRVVSSRSMKHQPVPGSGPDRPLTRPIGQPRLPARPQLGDHLSQDLRGQAGHPAIGDRGGTGQRPWHTTTLPRTAHQHEEAVPLTMHEVVSPARCLSRPDSDDRLAAACRAP